MWERERECLLNKVNSESNGIRLHGWSRMERVVFFVRNGSHTEMEATDVVELSRERYGNEGAVFGRTLFYMCFEFKVMKQKCVGKHLSLEPVVFSRHHFVTSLTPRPLPHGMFAHRQPIGLCISKSKTDLN